MRLVLLLACLLGLGLGATLPRKPHPCKSPPLLSGDLTFTSQNEKVLFYAPYEYDAIDQRIRMYEVGKYENQSYTFDALLLFKQHVMYQIDHEARKCTKLPLKADFVPLAVPPNSNLLGSYVLGGSSKPGEGVLVNTWAGVDPAGAQYLMTMSHVDCFPVSIMAQTKEYGWVSLSYLNGVQGLSHPEALNPPSFCPDQHAKPQGKPMDFFTVIKNMGKNAP